MIGNGSIGVSQKRQSGSPFIAGSAHNGTSIDAAGKVVLGQDVGAVGNPGGLLNDREIPLLGKVINFKGNNIQFDIEDVGGSVHIRNTPLNYFFINAPTGDLYGMGDLFGTRNGNLFQLQTTGGIDQALFKNTARTVRMGINCSGLGNSPDYNLDLLGNFGVSDNATPSNRYSTSAAVVSLGNFVNNSDNKLLLQKYGNSAGSNTLLFYKTRGANPNTVAAVNSGDQLGTISAYGVDSTPTTQRLAVRILYTAGTVGAAFVGGEIFWQTTNNAGTLSNRMKLTENGTLCVGTTAPNASSKVQFESTTQGFAQPRMTTAQKNAIAAPLVGLSVFDTTLNEPCVFDGAWKEELISAGAVVAPALNVAVVPAQVYGAANGNYLGDPVAWADVKVGGVAFKLPLY